MGKKLSPLDAELSSAWLSAPKRAELAQRLAEAGRLEEAAMLADPEAAVKVRRIYGKPRVVPAVSAVELLDVLLAVVGDSPFRPAEFEVTELAHGVGLLVTVRHPAVGEVCDYLGWPTEGNAFDYARYWRERLPWAGVRNKNEGG